MNRETPPIRHSFIATTVGTVALFPAFMLWCSASQLPAPTNGTRPLPAGVRADPHAWPGGCFPGWATGGCTP